MGTYWSSHNEGMVAEDYKTFRTNDLWIWLLQRENMGRKELWQL